MFGDVAGVPTAAAILNTNRTDFKPLSELITAFEMRQMLKYFFIQAKTCSVSSGKFGQKNTFFLN